MTTRGNKRESGSNPGSGINNGKDSGALGGQMVANYEFPAELLPSLAEVEGLGPGHRLQPPPDVGCFYCGGRTSVRWERDHWPLPRELGGTEMVWACQNCHDLKDRVPIHEWPVEVFARAFSELQQVEGMGRLILAVCLRTTLHANARLRELDGEVPHGAL